jgi:hypothetical protein
MKNKIQDIAPLLADDFVDFDVNTKTRKKYLKLVTDNSLRLGVYKKYLGLLHDSRVISTNVTKEKFSITLNDFTTHVFADVIVDRQKLKIEHDNLVFPIQIDFEITNLTFNTVDESGNIKNIEQTNFDDYLYEQIISVDNDIIEVGLVVWKNGIKNERGQHILILISAKDILLTELQDKAWADLFADKYNEYYKYFKSQLDLGRYLSDQSLCNELIDEYDQMNN